MSGTLRSEVLQTFKKLHRTRKNTFQGDKHVLEVVRQKINSEYEKSKSVTDEKTIKELNNHAKAVEYEIRTTIIQAVEVSPGRFEARITPDVLIDNAELPLSIDNKPKNTGSKKCMDVKKK
ncbi:complex III assembly factor LYRM7 [Orussus abietinus]|uniref:complex III assembly factor LYRM7 n=1 Tax=Orussus abietinus TaxID=222816 RepID=UPI000625AF2A|nr:complex III assembly factor LYRM7 [Orussus abietinus]